MKKYLFLDFDGVINTQNDKFEKSTIVNLRRLLERSDAKVIISSTWRLQGLEYILQLWQKYHLPGEVIGLTPSCNSIMFSNVKETEEWQSLYTTKGLEIAEWLRLNAKAPYRYVILDDEEDILFTQQEHFVKVDSSKGLSKTDVRSSIKILNTKELNPFKYWLYCALKYIVVYIFMMLLCLAYFYWYPEKEVKDMNSHALMYQECLRNCFHRQK